jgi:hypothetical protein
MQFISLKTPDKGYTSPIEIFAKDGFKLLILHNSKRTSGSYRLTPILLNIRALSSDGIVGDW